MAFNVADLCSRSKNWMTLFELAEQLNLTWSVLHKDRAKQTQAKKQKICNVQSSIENN